MSLRRPVSLILAAALLSASVTATAPAFAKPNTGAYAKSGEAFKAQMNDNLCGSVKGYLDHAEKEADKRAGTKAAEKWSKLADSWWQTGVDLGCSWTA